MKSRIAKLDRGRRARTFTSKRFSSLSHGLLLAAAFSAGSCADAGGFEEYDDELQLGVQLEELGIEVVPCTQAVTSSTGFSAGSKTLNLTLLDGVDAVMTVVNGKLRLNGWQCRTASVGAIAAIDLTSTNVNLIKISAQGTNKVVIDLLPGAYGGIFSTAAGGIIVKDVGSGTFAAPTPTGNVSLGVRANASPNAVKMAQEGVGLSGPFYLEVSGDSRADIKFDGNPATVNVALGDGADSFTAQGQVLTTSHLSGAGATKTVGPDTPVTVFGGVGADTLKGGLGDDTLNGGDGNDVFQTSASSAALSQDGADTYIGGAGVDLVDYSSRTDPVTVSIAPSFSNGWIRGLNLHNVSVGNGLVLSCLDGVAGATPDAVTFPTGPTVGIGPILDELSRLAGADASVNDRGELVLVSKTPGQNISCATSSAGVLLFGATAKSNDGVTQLDLDANDGFVGEADDVHADVENITGGTGADVLTGSAVSNTINGGEGNDDISGGIGAFSCAGDVDVLNGGDGDDVFRSGFSKNCGDALDGGPGKDTANYEMRTTLLLLDIDGTPDDGDGEGDTIKNSLEVIVGGSGGDIITGGSGGDELHGGGGADLIVGGAGADTIVGGPGVDTLIGGTGEDVFNETDAPDLAFSTLMLPSLAAEADVLNGGADFDTANYARNDTTPMGVTLCSAPAILTGSGNCVGDSADVDGDDITNCEHFIGGKGADTIIGSTGDDMIDGGDGNDSILGGLGDDQLGGDLGNDTLDGGGGSDTLDGGGGVNVNDGGPGDDICSGALVAATTNCSP